MIVDSNKIQLPVIKSGDRITAYYDLKSSPVTFDFVFFLAAACLYARGQGSQELDLVIVADSWRNLTPRERTYGWKERKWRLWNLIMQVVQICPMIKNVSLTSNQLRDFKTNCFPIGYHPQRHYISPYTPKFLKQFLKDGITPKCFTSSEMAKEYVRARVGENARFITLSLRQAAFDNSRDSTLDNWAKAYNILKERGFRVFVIPDQDDYLRERKYLNFSWECAEECCLSLDLRIAYYELAVQNVLSGGGIAAPVQFTEAPFTILNLVNPESEVGTEGFLVKIGVSINQDFEWYSSNQHNLWGPDSVNNIVSSVRLEVFE